MQSASSSSTAASSSAHISIPFWKCNRCNVHWQAISANCTSCGQLGFGLSLRVFEISSLIYAVSCIKDLQSEEKAFEEFDTSLNMDAGWINLWCRPLIQAAWFAIGGDNPPTHPKIALALKSLERFYEYAPDTPKCMYFDKHAYRYTLEEHVSNADRFNTMMPNRTIPEMIASCETFGHI